MTTTTDTDITAPDDATLDETRQAALDTLGRRKPSHPPIGHPPADAADRAFGVLTNQGTPGEWWMTTMPPPAVSQTLAALDAAAGRLGDAANALEDARGDVAAERTRYDAAVLASARAGDEQPAWQPDPELAGRLVECESAVAAAERIVRERRRELDRTIKAEALDWRDSLHRKLLADLPTVAAELRAAHKRASQWLQLSEAVAAATTYVVAQHVPASPFSIDFASSATSASLRTLKLTRPLFELDKLAETLAAGPTALSQGWVSEADPDNEDYQRRRAEAQAKAGKR